MHVEEEFQIEQYIKEVKSCYDFLAILIKL